MVRRRLPRRSRDTCAHTHALVRHTEIRERSAVVDARPVAGSWQELIGDAALVARAPGGQASGSDAACERQGSWPRRRGRGRRHANRPEFSVKRWAALFCIRFAHAAGPEGLGAERAVLLPASLCDQPARVAMQWIKFFSNAWTTASRMGQILCACVLGCLVPDCLRHCLVCPVLESALAQSLGPRLPGFGLVSDGVPPQWRQVAVVAEVVNSTGHVRTAAETAALAMTQACRDRMQSAADRVAFRTAEILPRRRVLKPDRW